MDVRALRRGAESRNTCVSGKLGWLASRSTTRVPHIPFATRICDAARASSNCDLRAGSYGGAACEMCWACTQVQDCMMTGCMTSCSMTRTATQWACMHKNTRILPVICVIGDWMAHDHMPKHHLAVDLLGVASRKAQSGGLGFPHVFPCSTSFVTSK